jgi:hypothetical protein
MAFSAAAESYRKIALAGFAEVKASATASAPPRHFLIIDASSNFVFSKMRPDA